MRRALSKLKDQKAPGHDMICNEQLKYGSTKLTKHLTKLYNNILTTKSIPQNWNLSKIILLHKKGGKDNIKNYRPISLMPTLAKVLSSMTNFRLRSALAFQQSDCQAGFRKGSSTVDHLHTVNLIIQGVMEYGLEAHLAFVDFTKAFDLLKQNFMLQALLNHGINSDLVQLIQGMYKRLKAQIITDREGEPFDIKRGMRQGDPVSLLLFNCAEIFRNLDWENKGIKINGEYLNNLRFADDVVVISDN